jgi:hypothetical protein
MCFFLLLDPLSGHFRRLRKQLLGERVIALLHGFDRFVSPCVDLHGSILPPLAESCQPPSSICHKPATLATVSDVNRLLTLVNGAALHKALREQGVGVSYRTVARWIGATPSAKPPAELMPALEAVLGTTKEAAPPEWAERLQATVDAIHARQDQIMERQGMVANGATQRLIEALAPLDRLQNSLDFLERLEEQLPPLGEGAHEESGAPGQDEAAPQGR